MRTTTPQQVLTYLAPAKANLTLAVLGRRPDGYHDIESWVVMLGWYDRLTFRESTGLSLTVDGRQDGLPAAESNLVWRAAVALAKAAGLEAKAAIGLEKDIPIGAGLGGGSSDAAATLLGLTRLWRLAWPVERLLPVAAELGSDVPVFLRPGAAVIRGRGEDVERLSTGWQGWLAVILPPYPVATAAVYERWTIGGFAACAKPPAERRPWRRGSMGGRELAALLFNDLEGPAFAVEPRLQGLHGLLDGLDGRRVRMTGSGSALFTVFDTEAEALAWSRRAGEQLGGQAEVRVVPTV